LRLQQKNEIVSFLFKNQFEIQHKEQDGTIELATLKELNEIVDFNLQVNESSSKDWVTGYITKWIKRDGIYTYRLDHKIQGVFEVRHSEPSSKAADLGMLVAKEYRNKGLGTYLLGKAKAKAMELGLKPICACDASNIGSLKCIERNGFVVEHLGLSVAVKP